MWTYSEFFHHEKAGKPGLSWWKQSWDKYILAHEHNYNDEQLLLAHLIKYWRADWKRREAVGNKRQEKKMEDRNLEESLIPDPGC